MCESQGARSLDGLLTFNPTEDGVRPLAPVVPAHVPLSSLALYAHRL